MTPNRCGPRTLDYNYNSCKSTVMRSPSPLYLDDRTHDFQRHVSEVPAWHGHHKQLEVACPATGSTNDHRRSVRGLVKVIAVVGVEFEAAGSQYGAIAPHWRGCRGLRQRTGL